MNREQMINGGATTTQFTCAAYQHKHPSRTVALRTRSRRFGILNFAVSLRGTSCGWGTCARPRRTALASHARLVHSRAGLSPDELQWDDPALVAAEQAEVEASRQGKPDQSLPASRARAREERLREAQHSVEVLGPAGAPAWRQAEAGTVQHLVLWGRPLCAADDAGPWRTVAGVPKCAGCHELEEVLARHG